MREVQAFQEYISNILRGHLLLLFGVWMGWVVGVWLRWIVFVRPVVTEL